MEYIDDEIVAVKSLDEMSESELFEEIRKLTKKFQLDIEYRTFDYEELVKYFHEYMMPLVEYSPLNLYNNSLFKFIKSQLGNEIPGCFQEEFLYYEEDEDFKSSMQEIIDYYKGVIESGDTVSDSEFSELYKLLQVDDENSFYFAKYMLGQVIDGNNWVNESEYRLLISTFVNKLVELNNLPMTFTIGKLEREDYVADSIAMRGHNFTTFDKTHLSTRTILENLEDIFHEIWHTVQADEDYNDSDIVTLIKIDDYIWRVFGNTYYDDNYSVLSSETDANLHAVWLLGEFLKEVSPEAYRLNKVALNLKSDRYADLLYTRKRYFKGEMYDVDVLFEAACVSNLTTREAVLGNTSQEKKLLKEITFK